MPIRSERMPCSYKYIPNFTPKIMVNKDVLDAQMEQNRKLFSLIEKLISMPNGEEVLNIIKNDIEFSSDPNISQLINAEQYTHKKVKAS